MPAPLWGTLCIVLLVAWASGSAGAAAAHTETFTGTIRLAVGLPGDTELGLPAQGMIEVAEGKTATRVAIAWDAASAQAKTLHLQACDRACVEGPHGVLATAQGTSPLGLHVPPTQHSELHWRVLAADGVSVAQPFDGQVIFEASPTPAPPATASQAPGSAPQHSDWQVPMLLALGFSVVAFALHRGLRLGPFVVLLRHRHGTDPLDHPKRRAIYDLVAREPGIHFRALQRALATGHGNLDRHLRRLVHAGLLCEANHDGLRSFAVTGHLSPTVHLALGVLRSPGARTLLLLLLEQPSQGVRALARTSGMAASTVARHLDRFHAAGLIERGPPRCRFGNRPTPLAATAADVLSR